MSIARSGIVWTAAKVVTLLLSWVALMVFTRVLQRPEIALGQYYLFETVVAFFVLLGNGGVNQAITKRVSEGEEQGEILVAGLIMSVALLLVSSFVVLLSSNIITNYFQAGWHIIPFIALAPWALQFRSYVSSALEGFSRVGLSGGISLLEVFVKTVVQMLLVWFGFGLFGLLTGVVLGGLVSGLAGLLPIVREFRRPKWRHVRSITDFAKYATVKEFTSKFYNNIDVIVITFLIGNAAVAYYSVGFRFALLLTVFSSGISVSSFPEISRHKSNGNQSEVVRIVGDGLVFTLLFSIPATVGILLVAERAITLLYTEQMVAAFPVAIIAVAVKIPDSVRYVFTSAIEGFDRPEIPFRAGLILIGANAVLDLLLVPLIGIEGAAVASFVGITLSTVYLGYICLRELGIKWQTLPLRPIAVEVIAAVVMGAAVYSLDQVIQTSTILEVGTLVSTGVIVYFVFVFALSPGIRQRVAGIVADFMPFQHSEG